MSNGSHRLVFDFGRQLAIFLSLFLLTVDCSAKEIDAGVGTVALIDVTCIDKRYVLEPILANEPKKAKENSRRIHAILTAASEIGCVIYFPGGNYYFDGAATGWQGSIETTHPFQTIRGAGGNGTRLLQVSKTVSCTIRLKHAGCAVSDLYVGSADTGSVFDIGWERSPHQTAIHLDGPISDGKSWPTDPRIQNVNINSKGNSILLHAYSRPFKTGIKISGSWLNVYVHTIFMTDVFTGIEVDQGPVMAGPAKFIDVNFYSTHANGENGTQAWSTFFKSCSNFMEQVELIHCTFIGAQFIYMDGRAARPEDGLSPVYDMVIDHCYINVNDIPCGSPNKDDAKWSGIYMNLPPKKADRKDGNYSRDIRFTNNSCTGRAPTRGAFFYVEGMCRGITFADNDISCGFDNEKCIYIRPTANLEADSVSKASDIGIRDIKIYDNYFRNWQSLVTIGGDKGDPSRGLHDGNSLAGKDESLYYVQRVNITNNQSMHESNTEDKGLTSCYLNRCRQVIISNNNLAEKLNSGIVIRNSEDALVSSNNLGSLDLNNPGYGIAMFDCTTGSVMGNALKKFKNGIFLDKSQHIAIGNNALNSVGYGISCLHSSQISIDGNVIRNASVGIECEKVENIIIFGNVVDAKTPIKGATELEKSAVLSQNNIGL